MRAARFGPWSVAIGALGLLLWTGAGTATRADTGSASEPAIRVGVVVVDAINIDRTDAIGLGDRLASSLTEALVVEVVNSSAAAERLKPAASDDCVIKQRCIRTVGEQLGVDEILFLTMVRVGEQTKINITWAEASSADALPRDPLTVNIGADVVPVFTRAAYALLPNAASRRERIEPVDGADSGDATVDVSSTTEAPTAGGRSVPTASWIAGGVGAVALAVGGGFGVAALRLDDTLTENCPEARCDAGRSQDIDARRRYIKTADVLYGVAAAAGATALILYWLSGDKAESNGVGVTATPDRVGVFVGARF